MSTKDKAIGGPVRVTQETDDLVSSERIEPLFRLLTAGKRSHLAHYADWILHSTSTSPDPLGIVNSWQLKSWAVCDADLPRPSHIVVLLAASHPLSWGDALVADSINAAQSDVTAGSLETATESEDARIKRLLQQACARRELGDLESRRAIWKAHNAGWSQREIGSLVGRSQPDVGRTIKKVDAKPSSIDVTPREIALRRLVGEYSAAEMIARLLTFEYTHGEAESSIVGSGYMPGTWDQVRELRDQDLISESEWRELFRAVIGERAATPVALPDELP